MTDEMNAIHRELGKHEGRLDSLESDVGELTRGLTGMHEKVNQIWQTICTTQGVQKGKISEWAKIGAVLTILIAGGSLYVAVKALYLSGHS